MQEWCANRRALCKPGIVRVRRRRRLSMIVRMRMYALMLVYISVLMQMGRWIVSIYLWVIFRSELFVFICHASQYLQI
jgi:hypothetical protein